MDELVHHCLRELSFDGDLGCNVSRLRDFIVGFYAAQDDNIQLVDDAFCAFVWSIVVQQPSVRVGTLPPGLPSEVYIAPQTSARRKAAAKGEEFTDGVPPSLELVDDARHRHLEDLKREHSDNLRIAVDPETSFAAITGSHIRPPKLSPMVYSALQLITRGREDGITTVELGRKTGYDQKTCFYLIKQLLELDLIIKARRGGVGNHTCIHKYFVERSPLWQQIQEETRNSEGIVSSQPAKPRDTADEETTDQDASSQVFFEPIDSRHLSSLPLVKNRIVKLLKASRNYIHQSNNLLMTIGFMHPTKTDRRFFQTRLRELIQQGVIERILVPSSKAWDRTIKCIRLVTSDNQLPEGSVVVEQDVEEDEKEPSLAEDTTVGYNEVKANLTIHKQVSNMLEEAGPSGLTLNEICVALGNFDKRTIELLLTRASSSGPPAHLGDLGTVDLMETYGRERRHRYFILAAYRSVMAKEKLQDTTTSVVDVDLPGVGDFAALNPKQFYPTSEKLHSYQDSFKDVTTAKGKKRKRDEGAGDGEESEPLPKRKRGRPRKTLAPMDTSPTTLKKRGRPRKNTAKGGEAKSIAPGGSVSERVTETCAEGVGQNVALSTGQGIAISQPAGVSHSIQFGQETSVGSSVAVDSGDQQSVVMNPDRQSIGVSQSNRLLGSSDVELGILHHASEEGVRDRQPRHFTKASLRRSSKRAKAPKLIADHPATHPRDDGVGASDAPQLLETGGPNSTMSLSLITQGEETTATVSDTMQLAQESSQTPSRREATGEKHKDAALSPSSRPSKRSRTDGGRGLRSNINISTLRRENELVKVIENMGGIANMHSKDIFEAHTALLDAMSQTKEPTSAPAGTRLDKRTAESTFKSLENHGRIKMLKTSLTTPSGISRPACLVYFPNTPQEQINAFLRQLSQSVPSTNPGPVKVLDEPVEYGPSVSSGHQIPLPLNLLQIEDEDEKENERLHQLFSCDKKTIHDVLLTERTTVAQLYGFVVGKALRMRHLHLHMLELVQQVTPTPFVVSREHRIVDITYFYQDITLAAYCSLVAVVAHDEELDALFSGEGQQTLVKDLSPNLRMSLGIGKSRSRSRILELMELLRSLGLVTPMERAEALDAPFQCTDPSGDTIAFRDASLEGWSASTPVLAPLFWRLHSLGPIYLWALSESLPSYWKEHPTRTLVEGKAYWDELHKVSRDSAYAQAATCPSTSPPMPAKISAGFGRCLRRRSSWDPEHVLTWHQKQYLALQIDATGETPLSMESSDARLNDICYVTSAPRQVVANYFTTSGEIIAHDLEKVRQRIKRNRKAEEAQSIEVKSALRKKAEEARAEREQDWDDLLHRIHPDPIKGTLAVRIRAVRSRFMQSTSTKDQLRWENEIQEVITKTRLVSDKVKLQLKASSGVEALVHATGPPPVVPSPPEKSIVSLINQQGPPVMVVSAKKKGKAKEESETSRRPRFHWTREFDELARDASAIIRARCRDSRLDLSAFDQVFPAAPRNSVRQRIMHLRENAAEDLYMKRLEDQWYTVWLQYRGTAHLPDEDPGSPSNFNIIKHIEFLRNHVDKNALRVGFVERKAPIKLGTSVEKLYEFYEVTEDVVSTPAWDFMWGTTVEEGREKQFRSQAFTKEPDRIYEGTTDEKVQLAEAAMKMVFGTPSELYDPDIASSLLHSVGDQCISVARSNLLQQGILSKVVRDPKKPKPGRMLKISDINLSSIGGPFPRDLFQDATSLEDIVAERVEDEMDWPIITSEGDIATLLQLVSEDQVGFSVDLSRSQAARPKIDWNSKRADDEDVETGVRFRFRAPVTDPGGNRNQHYESPAIEPDANAPGQEIHGTTIDGKKAACSLKTETGLINCSACINTTFESFTSSLIPSDRDFARRIFDDVRSRRETGLNKAACLRLEAGLEQHILGLVHKMTLTSPPVLFWKYLDTLVLLSGDYCRTSTVVVSDEPLTLITPRRWLDLRGYRLDGPWAAAQQAVVGVIFLHPGISQAELRWRLRAVYDRQEIIDIVSSLQEDDVLECRTDASVEGIHSLPGWVRALDDEEKVFWFISRNHRWYQI